MDRQLSKVWGSCGSASGVEIWGSQAQQPMREAHPSNSAGLQKCLCKDRATLLRISFLIGWEKALDPDHESKAAIRELIAACIYLT